MIWRLRVLAFYTIISVVSVLFFLFLWFPIKLIGAPFGFRYKVGEVYSYIFIYAMWFTCSIKFSVEGDDILPKDGKPYLLLSNHQSFWENFFMQLIIAIHAWVVIEELLDVPFLGLGLEVMRPIAVNRSSKSSGIQILREGKIKIESGLSMVIFPEGGTVPVGRDVRFKPSAAKLAKNTGVPVVLMVHNAGRMWPKGFWFKQPGTITVQVIEYISSEQIEKLDARELNDHIQEKINVAKNKLIDADI